MATAQIIGIAQSFVAVTEESKEIGSELKELKQALTQFFEEHPEEEQVQQVRCQRAPKKKAANPKKVMEIVQEEILKTPASTGNDLIDKITNRLKDTEAQAPSEVQIKLSIIGEKKPRKKAKTP